MTIFRHKITGTYRAMLADGKMSKAFATREELLATLKQLQRRARRRETYQAHLDCGQVKTPYGWE